MKCGDEHTETCKPWGTGWMTYTCTMEKDHGGKWHNHFKTKTRWPKPHAPCGTGNVGPPPCGKGQRA